jgi:hypothetical protein
LAITSGEENTEIIFYQFLSFDCDYIISQAFGFVKGFFKKILGIFVEKIPKSLRFWACASEPGSIRSHFHQF